MEITIFGASGALGQEILKQALDAGHNITVLLRSKEALPPNLLSQITVIEGDGLNEADVARALNSKTDAVIFAIGVRKSSPENLCTNVTKIITQTMKDLGLKRFIWCGGGSTLVAEDNVTFGARTVEKIARVFMPLKHHDKTNQYQFLTTLTDIDWIGIRPLQMNKGSLKAQYKLGFDQFSGFSSISFADCAHAMVSMIEDDTWIGKAPIIQY